MVLPLKADSEGLYQEQADSNVPTPFSEPIVPVSSAYTSASVTNQLVIVPRDCKCPMLNGKMGIGEDEWKEEVQA